MKLVVGLGNPGPEYAQTRHNVGFEAVDCLAARFNFAGPGEFDRVARTRFESLTLDGTLQLPGGSEKAMLLKPMTFMNLSGRAVQAAMAFYQLARTDLMVLLDDLALPCGKIRLRAEGSSGGHNGLKDIERALSSSAYPRLRIGIDEPPPRVAGRDYVLARFTTAQRAQVARGLERAVDAVQLWIERGIAPAMNKFNADDTAVGQPKPA